MPDNDQAGAPDQIDEPELEWSADEAAASAATEIHATLVQEAEMEAVRPYRHSGFPHDVSAAVSDRGSSLPGQDPAAQASLRRQRPARGQAR
jgi:hypothetical protein